MAEHNTQDTKSPVPPRRGARPFVGPAGAAGQPLPLLRVTSMPRPASRPFVPAPAVRAALGTAGPVAPPALPVAEAVQAAPIIDATSGAFPEVIGEAIAAPDPAPDSVPAPTDWAVPEPDASDAPTSRVAESPYDQFAAFDEAWHEAAVDVSEPAADPPPPLDISSLGSSGDAQLAWAADVTGDVAAPTSTDDAGVPSWLMDDIEAAPAPDVSDEDAHEAGRYDAAVEQADVEATNSVEDGLTPDAGQDDPLWAEVSLMPSADAIMAEGVAAAEPPAEPVRSSVAYPADVDEWPGPLLAEYAPYVATPPIADSTARPDEANAEALLSAPETPSSAPMDAGLEVRLGSQPDATDTGGALAATFAETLDGVGDQGAASPTSVAAVHQGADTHADRVAASLDRLAEQIRGGEIDVSSVLPGGPDAAVLAAVLAALLGGGRSSSR